MNKGILSGTTVLDLTRVLSGPYCTMLLADMGAHVIKIEEPEKGDDSRRFGTMIDGESAYFLNFNRNKKGITLNLKSQKGKELFLKMVGKADIVVENFRPGVMENLGLGYDVLKEANPKIIYGCVSGFGQYGPYSHRPCYDIIGQAQGGMMSITGYPGGEPLRCGTSSADIMGGLGITIGILSALVNQLRNGEGEMVDVAMVDAIVSSLQVVNQIYLASERIPGRKGNQYESTYPCDSFRSKDGPFVLACANDKLFTALAKEIGRPELAEDARFCSNVERMANAKILKSIIEEWSAQFTRDSIISRMVEIGIPAAQVNGIDDVVKDPHIAQAREMFVSVNHPKVGKLKLTGNHLKFKNHKVEMWTPAPELGQDNIEIYQQMLGLTAEEVLEYKSKGIF